MCREWLSIIVPTLLVALLACACRDTQAQDNTSAFIEWAGKQAVPLKTVEPDSGFDDLQPLKQIVGDARVVCLGESRHDIHEQFRLKHRLVQFLVEELGFRVLVLEESLPHARPLNDYILGGEGDIQKLLGSTGGWFAWDNAEMVDLFRWLRRYNAAPDRSSKVRFFGVDVTGPGLALENVLAYLERVDPEHTRQLRERRLGQELFADQQWWITWQRYAALPPPQREELGTNFEGLLARLEQHREEYNGRSSADELEWAHRQARVVIAGHGVFSSSSRAEGGILRDRAMADNVFWILEHQAPDERVIIWAHNAHITRAPFSMPGVADQPVEGLAFHLAQRLGDRLVTIGAAFGKGRYTGSVPGEVTFELSPPDYLDGALARVGLPCFVLDLRRAPKEGPVHDWLHAPRKHRGQDMDMLLTPAEAYDAMYYVAEASRATPNPAALERFRAMSSAPSVTERRD